MVGATGGGVADCEAHREGLIAQPATAWSSLAFGVAAGWIAARRERRSEVPVAVATAVAGAGALLFHASGGAWAARLDAAGVAAVTATLAVAGWTDRAQPGAATLVAVALVAVALPAAVEPLAVVCGIAALAGIRRLRSVFAVALPAAAGGALWWLGRTGGPLCQPSTWAQAHAGWHLLSAAAVAAFVAAKRSATPRGLIYPERRSTVGGERPDDATA